MIRIQRPATAPTSLNTPVIQQYLSACAQWQTDHAAWLANPTGPEPQRPTRPNGYRNSDLLDAFDTHFHAKCYLTEQKFANSWEMDVDHFAPVNQNPALAFDWHNLFPAAHKANMLRPKTLPPGGLLNPCVDDVETEILYALGALGEAPAFAAKDTANLRAVNTAQLLNDLHNGKSGDHASHKNTAELRRLVERKYKELLLAWGTYNDAKTTGDEDDMFQAETELRTLLSRRASFTMLLRSVPFVRKRLPAHWLD